MTSLRARLEDELVALNERFGEGVSAYRVQPLRSRSFVGTESRLNIAPELLRQVAFGAETDPGVPFSGSRSAAPPGPKVPVTVRPVATVS
ncbi:hypothetical protein [Plantactinospora sp. B24E8]|uniref:hypothetical protein n=1 Tax=Plantactinospora sp. B24E8 TaxID=3153567 RepID=UPI00325DEC50